MMIVKNFTSQDTGFLLQMITKFAKIHLLIVQIANTM